MNASVAVEVERAQAFLQGWRALSSSDEQRLTSARRFVEGLKRLGALPLAPSPLRKTLIERRTVEGLLAGLRKPLEQARRLGAFADVWAVAGLGRREVPNAAVLAWLLDPRGSHGQGAACLGALLKRVALKAPHLHYADDVIASARVEAEQRPLGSDRDRVDIVIEAQGLIIFVEVKIDAVEGEAQLSRYTESAQRVVGARYLEAAPMVSPLVVFLSPRASSEVVSNLVHLTWRDIAVALSDVGRTVAGPARLLIQSFARHTRSFR